MWKRRVGGTTGNTAILMGCLHLRFAGCTACTSDQCGGIFRSHAWGDYCRKQAPWGTSLGHVLPNGGVLPIYTVGPHEMVQLPWGGPRPLTQHRSVPHPCMQNMIVRESQRVSARRHVTGKSLHVLNKQRIFRTADHYSLARLPHDPLGSVTTTASMADKSVQAASLSPDEILGLIARKRRTCNVIRHVRKNIPRT